MLIYNFLILVSLKDDDEKVKEKDIEMEIKNVVKNENEADLEGKDKETNSKFRETENLDVIREDNARVEIDISPAVDKI